MCKMLVFSFEVAQNENKVLKTFFLLQLEKFEQN